MGFETDKDPRRQRAALSQISWGRLNKKDGLTGYGDSHVKDKTSYRPSYL